MKSAISFAIFSELMGLSLPIGLAYAEGWFHTGPIYCVLAMLGGGFISVTVWLLCVKVWRCNLSRLAVLMFFLTIFALHYVTVFATVFAGLAIPMQIWGQGFVDGIDHRIGLNKIQEWGEEAVNRFERSELKLDGKCDYVAGYAPKLAATEIPSWLENGWYQKPQIGTHDGGGWIKEPHIVFTWYEYSLSVGRRNLTFEGKPQTLMLLRTPRPGLILTYWDVK